MAKPENKIHNEIAKLEANGLNGIAIAIIALGILKPAFEEQALSAYIWIGTALLALVFHATARLVLHGLREE